MRQVHELPPVLPQLDGYRPGMASYDKVRFLAERKALAARRMAVRSAAGRHELNVRWGRGPDADVTRPVVLVHGYGISSAYMVPLAVRLAPFFPVYAPDLPGHGWSEKPLHVLDVRDLADVLLAWMDALRLERPVLVGNSMGCQIVADLAARRPDRASHIVLLGPTADREARTLRRHIPRFVAATVHERLSLVPLLAADYLRARPHRMWLEMRHMLDDAIEDKLPHVTAPTLIVRGGRDFIAPQRWVEELVRRLPDGRAHVLDGWGHAINYSAAPSLARLVTDFVRQVTTPRCGGRVLA